MIKTSQLKRLAAALRSRLVCLSCNSDRFCKNATVSGSPWISPWRMSKFSMSLKKEYTKTMRQLYCLLLGHNKEKYNPEKWSDTHKLNADLPSSTGEPGVVRPSWFSAVAYHSGIVISRPGALWSWYPRTMASRNLLAPLS